MRSLGTDRGGEVIVTKHGIDPDAGRLGDQPNTVLWTRVWVGGGTMVHGMSRKPEIR
ncbi:hypothetical protein L479_02552 [Exiguobacterium sp. S17]|nr:hypothetical protein L479_02552 [Exiguobacterium sp. S17]